MSEPAGIMETEAGRKLSLTGLLVGFIAGLPQLFFPILAVLYGAGNSDRGLLLMPVLIFGLLAASLLFRWISWMRFAYYIGHEDIRIESGLLNRSARSIPYERIQDVGIEQKPLARLFGLSEVKLETGSGSGDEAKLSYVTMIEAERLRALVRAHKSGVIVVPSPANAAAETERDDAAPPIFAMNIARVLTLGFYSFSLVILAILGGLAQQFDFLLSFDLYDIDAWRDSAKNNGYVIDAVSRCARIFAGVAALFGLIVIGFATGIIRTFLREYGFRLDVSPRGFRRRRGLLTLTDVVMPIHRVQAATIYTGPIRKRRGWHGLKFISLAGDSDKAQKGDSDHIVAPLANLAEIERILTAAKIDPAGPDVILLRGRPAWWLVQLMAAGLVIIAGMIALIVAADAGWKAMLLFALLPLALGNAFLQWRFSRYAVDGDNLLVCGGWWQQRMTIAPQIKIQTAEISQGPVARFFGLCKIHFGIAGGTLSISALRISEARLIAAQVIERVAALDYSKISAPKI